MTAALSLRGYNTLKLQFPLTHATQSLEDARKAMSVVEVTETLLISIDGVLVGGVTNIDLIERKVTSCYSGEHVGDIQLWTQKA